MPKDGIKEGSRGKIIAYSEDNPHLFLVRFEDGREAYLRHGELQIEGEKVPDSEESFLIGIDYAVGEEVKEDLEEAALWFRRAADGGHALAMTSLGAFYQNGDGVEANLSEAIRWYQKAAELNEGKALYRLGHFYWNGIILPHDEKKALECWRKSAEVGHEDGLYGLGRAYRYGMGVGIDEGKAASYFRSSEEKGSELAAIELCIMQEDGLGGIPKNPIKSRTYYLNHLEYPQCSFRLAVLSLKGNGLRKSLDDSLDWYRKAIGGLGRQYDFEEEAGFSTFDVMEDAHPAVYLYMPGELGPIYAQEIGYMNDPQRPVETSPSRFPKCFRDKEVLAMAEQISILMRETMLGYFFPYDEDLLKEQQNRSSILSLIKKMQERVAKIDQEGISFLDELSDVVEGWPKEGEALSERVSRNPKVFSLVHARGSGHVLYIDKEGPLDILGSEFVREFPSLSNHLDEFLPLERRLAEIDSLIYEGGRLFLSRENLAKHVDEALELIKAFKALLEKHYDGSYLVYDGLEVDYSEQAFVRDEKMRRIYTRLEKQGHIYWTYEGEVYGLSVNHHREGIFLKRHYTFGEPSEKGDGNYDTLEDIAARGYDLVKMIIG